MTAIEASDFIESVLKELWPDWNSTLRQVQNWSGMLLKYQYDDAKWAADSMWREGGSKRRSPDFKSFVVHAAKFLPKQARKEFVDSRWTVECIEGEKKGMKQKVFPHKMHLQDDEGYMDSLAQSVRTKCEQIYCGKWIVVKASKEIPDDGLRGEEAKAKAVENILAGPDTPGKRFLLRRRAEKKAAEVAAALKTIDEVAPPVDVNEERNKQVNALLAADNEEPVPF